MYCLQVLIPLCLPLGQNRACSRSLIKACFLFKNCRESTQSKNPFFLYLSLRSSIAAGGLPLNTMPLPHQLADLFFELPSNIRFVSFLYGKLCLSNLKCLKSTLKWEKDLHVLGLTPDWDTLCKNIFTSSKNLPHQLIHFKFAHRVYATPLRRFQMKFILDSTCQACHPGAVGTYLHVFWECPKIVNLWKHVIFVFNKVFNMVVPLSPQVLLLLDDS